MATNDFLNFIEQPTRRAIILVEVEPREPLDGWTLRSGVVYTNGWSSFVQTDLVPGGLYREIISIEEDGVELTRVTDQGNMASGTWFYSPGSDGEPFKLGDKLGDKLGAPVNTLLLQTTDDADPETKTLIRVKFRIYLSTMGAVYNNVYYEPRLTGKSLPTLTQETEDLFFGIAKKVSNGAVSLNNADGLFDKLAADWVWRNARVNLYIGGDDLDHTAGGGSDFSQIGQMLVQSFVPTLTDAIINVRDAHKLTLRQVPPNFFSSAIYPNMEDNGDGKPVPLLFGDMSASTGALTPIRTAGDGTNQTNNVYTIADASLQSLYAIGTVYNDGVAVGSTYVTKSLTGCTFAVLAGLSDLGAITANATGQPVAGNAWESSTDYLQSYGEIVSHIYTSILGLPAAEIDSAAALAADGAESAPQAVYLASQKAARLVIRDVERGVLGRTRRDAAGLISPGIWEPGIDSTNARSIADPEILEVEARRRIESVYSRVNIKYNTNPTLNSSKVTYTDNVRTKLLYLDDRDEELTLQTALTSDSAAKRLANRVAFMTQNPDVTVRLVETGIRLMDQIVGDRIYLTLARAPSSDGSWASEIFEIDKITKVLAPVPRVEVTLNNLRGIGGVVGIWTDNVVPAYPSSSSSDRAKAGWWLDDSNFADPSDASSKDVSVWW